jgi:DNA-binding transcriptional regulator YiaG
MTALLLPRAKLPNVPDQQEKTPPDDEPLIERFVKFRKAKGWTQNAAAERMGMSVNSLKAYERKSRTPNGPATLKLLSLMGALK